MKRILFAILLLALVGCGGSGASKDDLRILDLARAIDNERSFDLTEIAESVEFTPLDSEVPVGEIYKLLATDDKFYLLESNSNVKAFDREGNYLFSRGVIGRGPDEFNFILNFALDPATDNLYLFGYAGGNKLVGYNAEGKLFARADSLPKGGGDIAWHEGEVVMLPRGSFNREITDDLVPLVQTFTPDLKFGRTIETADKGSAGIISEFTSDDGRTGVSVRIFPPVLSDNGHDLALKETLSDTLFHYSAGRLEPEWILDLGDHTPPREAFGMNPAKSFDERYCTVGEFFEGDNHLIIALDGIENGHSLIFDRTTGECFATNNGYRVDGIISRPIAIRDNKLIAVIMPMHLVDHREEITNPDLAAIAARIKEDDNPVIAIVTLK